MRGGKGGRGISRRIGPHPKRCMAGRSPFVQVRCVSFEWWLMIVRGPDEAHDDDVDIYKFSTLFDALSQQINISIRNLLILRKEGRIVPFDIPLRFSMS